MSVSVTGNDLGSMGAPSSDTALAPLIAALTQNSNSLSTQSGALSAVEVAASRLANGIDQIANAFAGFAAFTAAITSLHVGIERLTAVVSSKSFGNAKKDTGVDDQASLDAGMAYGPGRADLAYGKELEKQTKIETEANLKESQALADLERNYIVKEYKGRGKQYKKDQEEIAKIERNAANIWRKGLEKQAKLREKEEQQRAQYQPAQESHVDAFKANEAAQAKIASEKDDAVKGMAAAGRWREGLNKLHSMRMEALVKEIDAQNAITAKAESDAIKASAEEASARALWRSGLEKIAAMKENDAVKAAAEEASARALWRDGLDRISNMEALAAVDAINQKESEDIKAAAEEASARAMWRDGLKKILEMRIAADKELHSTDRGGSGGPSGPSGGGGGTSFGGMGSFSASPVAQAGMALFSAINMAISGFNKLHSAVSALANSAMTYAPGIAIGMERALKDLDAVVGSYSAQVGASMIPLVRAIADYMYPTMLALGKAVALVIKSFTPLVETIMMVLMPVVTGLANIFTFLWKLLSPILDFLIAVLGGLGTVVSFLVGVINGLVNALSWAFEPIFGVLKQFSLMLGEAVAQIKKTAIKSTSWIPFIGEAVKEALTPDSTQGLAAASTAKYGNAQSLGEAAAQNAFIATSGQLTPEEEFAQQMIDNDIPNKWGMALDAQGRPVNIAVRKDDGFVGEGGGGNWDDAPQGKPLHGKNNAPIRMGM